MRIQASAVWCVYAVEGYGCVCAVRHCYWLLLCCCVSSVGPKCVSAVRVCRSLGPAAKTPLWFSRETVSFFCVAVPAARDARTPCAQHTHATQPLHPPTTSMASLKRQDEENNSDGAAANVSVGMTEGRGRGLFASAAMKEGSTILIERCDQLQSP